MLAFGAKELGMTEAEMQETVDMWRAASPKICAFWKDLEKSAIRSIVHKTHVLADCGLITFDYEQGILWMGLPSGRRLAYWGATYDYSKWNPDRKVISYMAQNQKTRKWERTETWGGKLVENATQGVSRDILLTAMANCTRLGFDIRAHVHDEIIVTEPISSGRTYEDLSIAMCPEIPWAKGLPLVAAGYEGKYYFKD